MIRKKQDVLTMAVLVMFLLLALTGCAPSTLSEAELRQGIPEEISVLTIGSEKQNFSVDSFVVEKRQISEKTDISYCIIELSNEYYRLTRYCTLTYNYYDKGGWVLDDWSENRSMDYSVKKNPFSDDQAIEAISWMYNSKVEILDSQFAPEKNSVTYRYAVEDVHYNMSYVGELTRTLVFDGYSWKESIDSTKVKPEWHLVGSFQFRKNANKDVPRLNVQIKSVDLAKGTVDGAICDVHYSLSGLQTYEKQLKGLTTIKETKDKVILDYFDGWITLTFEADSASAHVGRKPIDVRDDDYPYFIRTQ